MHIDHIGIAVSNIEEAAKVYKLMGLEIANIEEVSSQKVRVAMLPLGESKIELLEPTDPESPIQKFLDKKGSGIHHLAVSVDDVAAELDKLKEQGIRLINEEPVPGAGGALIAFVHPKETQGVLLELCQHE